MRASKSGYLLESTGSYNRGDPPTIYRWFRLGSSTPPIDLGGTYDLTFTADPACALPLEARSRRYLTSIPAGNATSRALTLSGASFVTVPGGYGSNVVYMSVFENFVRFYFSDPPIWETLASPTSLYIQWVRGRRSHRVDDALQSQRRIRILWRDGCRMRTGNRV
jgi:hypothetical protein